MTPPLTREEFGTAMKIVMESGGKWPRENLLAVQRAAEQIIANDAALRARLAEAEAAARKYGRHINACMGGDGCDCGGKDVAAALLAPERPA